VNLSTVPADTAPTRQNRVRGGSAFLWSVVLMAGLMLVASACGGDATVEIDPDNPSGVSQIGTTADDVLLWATAVGDGYVASGSTVGAVASDPAGGKDVYVRIDTSSGVIEDQFGTPTDDAALGNAVAPDGTIYVTGYTNGDLAATNQGSADIWLKAYAPSGEPLWTVQVGGTLWDRAYSVIADDTGAFVTGYTFGDFADVGIGEADAFVARFSTTGDLEWLNQYGSEKLDWGQGGAAAPDGGLFLVGFTEGSIGSSDAEERDAFVMRIAADGTLISSVQFGTPAVDWATSAVSTESSVVVVGHTAGSLGGSNSGDADVFAVAFDSDLSERWRLQFGTEAKDQGYGVAAVPGGYLISGFTMGRLGEVAYGDRDGVVAFVSDEGELVSVGQVGSAAVDETYGVVLTESGAVFVGYTTGSLGGQHLGGTDIIEIRYE